MPRPLGPNPGFVFVNKQAGPIWVTELIGIINTKMPAQADSTATTLAEQVIEFNDLLAKLKAAGLMEE